MRDTTLRKAISDSVHEMKVPDIEHEIVKGAFAFFMCSDEDAVAEAIKFINIRPLPSRRSCPHRCARMSRRRAIRAIRRRDRQDFRNEVNELLTESHEPDDAWDGPEDWASDAIISWDKACRIARERNRQLLGRADDISEFDDYTGSYYEDEIINLGRPRWDR